MVSVQRNSALEDLAQKIKKAPELAACLRSKEIQDCDPEFLKEFDSLYDEFGGLGWGEVRLFQDSRQLLDLLLAMAFHEKEKRSFKSSDAKSLEKDFLSRFEAGQRDFAVELIDLARGSYRLRDDDNIYLGKVEGQMVASLDEGKRRLKDKFGRDMRHLDEKEVINALRKPACIPRKRSYSTKGPGKRDPKLRARQIVGQPAGPGIAFGKARMVLNPEELFRFKSGEILVCDAVDPAMTLVVPLAAGVVERRGGMLIHGAIIAREYGIPCVTGVADAARWIQTGDTITVDGYLGIVIVGEATLESRS
jgi:pyruvate,water dikinase